MDAVEPDRAVPLPRLAHAEQVADDDAMPVHTADVLADDTVPSLVTAAAHLVGYTPGQREDAELPG